MGEEQSGTKIRRWEKNNLELKLGDGRREKREERREEMGEERREKNNRCRLEFQMENRILQILHLTVYAAL
jgi:hypothetical protein